MHVAGDTKEIGRGVKPERTAGKGIGAASKTKVRNYHLTALSPRIESETRGEWSSSEADSLSIEDVRNKVERGIEFGEQRGRENQERE